MSDRIAAALAVLALDPTGIGGLWLRGRAGPVRDAVAAALPPARRLHPGIDDASLHGALDLAATLAAGRSVMGRGLLSDPGLLTLTMAEGCPKGLAARLGAAMDAGTHGVVALDESDGDDAPPAALTDRLGLFLATDGLVWSDMAPLTPPDLAAARAALPHVITPAGLPETLARVAARLGIASLRAPLRALAAARALAALTGHAIIPDAAVRQAVELTLAHRARPATEPSPPPPEPPRPGEGRDLDRAETIPEDLLIAAARAALPPDLLAALAAGRAARAAKGTSGTGGTRAGNRRGRPLPARPGRLGTGARVDLIATLRAAAPWQPLRRQAGGDRLHIRPADIRLKRYRETSDRVLVFAVDASGSAALARLAEAKGAVELMLAQAYARRDHVALVAFRGTTAEVMLPPTRSLVQTKRRLAGLPGGGGTPLAQGLDAALALALQARARGLTPTLALLTDGRANIARDGSADRPRAATEADQSARRIAAAQVPAVVIDTATRPQPALAALARAMGAPCLPLPRAEARVLQAAIVAAMA